MGASHVKSQHPPPARRRRPRPRTCFRKGCGRKYQPRRWNQRYCQEPECQRQRRRWQAARRQARHRQSPEAKVRHAQAERARRQRTKAAAQAAQRPGPTTPRGHAAEFSSRSPLRSARLLRTACELTPQQGALLWPRLSRRRGQCPGSGAQVADSRHLGRAYEARLRVPGRTAPPAAAASERLRGHPHAGTAAMTPPAPRRSSLIARPPGDD
jgi:hypothetical protein